MERITITMQRPGDGAEVLATIEPDGSVSLVVRGARGLECRALTAELETSIGTVADRRMRPEVSADPLARLLNQGGGGFCG